ncbi:Uncharacterised protein [Klebsiella pneumoniae]|nr:Uncharacterised protein [Klebsiella pneumoniae]STU25658.1 Uncharacterised protein [Klebsiella pneumoniae]STW34160.1 Uncharacterised protein [Klebsiella pneumoniae]
MLERIRFKGFDIEGSSLYIKDDDSTEGGKFNVKFTEQKVIPQLDEDGNFLFIEVTPSMIGYPHDKTDSGNDEDVIFKAEVKLTLTFECYLEEEVSQETYSNNQWFFENYTYICTKLALEKILKDTVLETISLPWAPSFTDK